MCLISKFFKLEMSSITYTNNAINVDAVDGMNVNAKLNVNDETVINAGLKIEEPDRSFELNNNGLILKYSDRSDDTQATNGAIIRYFDRLALTQIANQVGQTEAKMTIPSSYAVQKAFSDLDTFPFKFVAEAGNPSIFKIVLNHPLFSGMSLDFLFTSVDETTGTIDIVPNTSGYKASQTVRNLMAVTYNHTLYGVLVPYVPNSVIRYKSSNNEDVEIANKFKCDVDYTTINDIVISTKKNYAFDPLATDITSDSYKIMQMHVDADHSETGEYYGSLVFYYKPAAMTFESATSSTVDANNSVLAFMSKYSWPATVDFDNCLFGPKCCQIFRNFTNTQAGETLYLPTKFFYGFLNIAFKDNKVTAFASFMRQMHLKELTFKVPSGQTHINLDVSTCQNFSDFINQLAYIDPYYVYTVLNMKDWQLTNDAIPWGHLAYMGERLIYQAYDDPVNWPLVYETYYNKPYTSAELAYVKRGYTLSTDVMDFSNWNISKLYVSQLAFTGKVILGHSDFNNSTLFTASSMHEIEGIENLEIGTTINLKYKFYYCPFLEKIDLSSVNLNLPGSVDDWDSYFLIKDPYLSELKLQVTSLDSLTDYSTCVESDSSTWKSLILSLRSPSNVITRYSPTSINYIYTAANLYPYKIYTETVGNNTTTPNYDYIVKSCTVVDGIATLKIRRHVFTNSTCTVEAGPLPAVIGE